VADVRNHDHSVEGVESRGDDRRDTRTVRGIERGARDPHRFGPAIDVPGMIEAPQSAARSLTDPEGPTPDEEVSRLGGQSDGDDVPENGDIRTDDPRDTGAIDGGSGSGRRLPSP
jgi:hypothetical protein